MFIPYSVVNALTTVRITRKLSRPGEVLVRNGDPVEPMHVVARAMKPAEFAIVDVARILDIPVKKVRGYYKIKRNDAVEQGDIIAAKGGHVCRAPIAGRIASRGQRRVLIEAESQAENLAALVPGVVVDVLPGSGVVIEVVGCMVQTAWGNGQQAFGTLNLAVREPGLNLHPEQISVAVQGSILVGAKTLDEQTLDEAVAMQVHGLVVGSVSPVLLPKLAEVPFPVLVTEGFGSVPMNQIVFDLLRSLDGRQITLCGDMGTRWERQRPYMMVPMPAQSGRMLNPDASMTVGDRIRILRGQHFGQTGAVASVGNEMMQLDTGARVPAISVEVGDGQVVQVPNINVERLL